MEQVFDIAGRTLSDEMPLRNMPGGSAEAHVFMLVFKDPACYALIGPTNVEDPEAAVPGLLRRPANPRERHFAGAIDGDTFRQQAAKARAEEAKAKADAAIKEAARLEEESKKPPKSDGPEPPPKPFL